MKKVDLNCDMGESFGAWTMGLDCEVIRHVTSANIACGYHAGDAHVMNRTVKLATDHGVGVGAHPGYPDLVDDRHRKRGGRCIRPAFDPDRERQELSDRA